MHLTYPDEKSISGPVEPEGSAGAPESLVCEHGPGLTPLPGEAKLPPEIDVIGKPCINLTQKVIKIMRSYKTGDNYFIPI